MQRFGQLVIGPPGSGKTTYCHGVKQLLESIGRKVAVVNIGRVTNMNCRYVKSLCCEGEKFTNYICVRRTLFVMFVVGTF